MTAKPRPFVAHDPAMKGGHPTIGGTGLLVELMAERIWGGTTEQEILGDWDYLTRSDLIVACWYQGTYGRPSWKKRWGDWARDAHLILHRMDDPASIPWPPTSKGSGS